MEGIIKDTNEKITAAVEISYRAHNDDVERAVERARILNRIMSTLPVGVSRKYPSNNPRLKDRGSKACPRYIRSAFVYTVAALSR
ncbi:hypothetical protein kam1_248 [Methylacidiphilum kamchatkense Kam1]|uniref:Uncharacterized protein n=1 Tax=Methylacidiphilum kamchatkense Kam1 TaxID=1202785 RepID=A0A516TJV6_9BACT|nr:hypothetical protein kam1_248 [Methylacidiphilum kamchatkense Kam1]